MHRNTAVVIIFLAIFAAIVVGVNLAHVGQNQSPPDTLSENSPTPQISSIPTSTPVTALSFDMVTCGISLSYPATFTKVVLENGATTFLDPVSPIDATTIDCKNSLPKQFAKDSTQATVMIGSVSATIYTPPQPATGSAQEKTKLYFRSPNVKKDVVISGSGNTLTEILLSLTIK
jgi:hypothetical protein